MAASAESGLLRSIGKWELAGVAINGIIGAGIFGLPAKAFALAGPYSILAFLACAVVVTLVVLCFAEAGSRYQATGGPYLYAREAFGSWVGFQVGWLTWLARLSAFAANCNLLVAYVAYFWHGVDRVWLVCGIVLALAVINVIGVRDAAVASNVFTIGKLLPLVFFIGAGVFSLAPERFAVLAPPPFGDFSTAVLLLVYAFTGFEMAAIPAGEVRDPRRSMPLALLTAIGVVTGVYVLVQVVSIGTLPGLAGSERPLADAAGIFLGPAGSALIAAGAIVSIAGNLNVLVLAASRLPFAMAERSEMPRIFARTHPRFRTPHYAILLTSGLMLALTVSGTFIYAVTISTLVRLASYILTCAAVPVLRRKLGPARFAVPGGSAAAVAAIALAVWLLANATLREARDTAIAALVGLAVFVISTRFCRGTG